MILDEASTVKSINKTKQNKETLKALTFKGG